MNTASPAPRRSPCPRGLVHGLPWRGSAGPAVRRTLAGSIVVLASSAACQESLTQLESGVVAPALRPALKIARQLPGLADLLTAGRPPGPEATLLAEWTESWNRGVAAGRPLREEIYRAAGSLALAVDSTSARSAAEAVRAALAEARSFGLPLPPHLTGSLAEAERLLAEADRAGSRTDWSASAVKALMAADALRETSPRTVALSLVEAAEEILGAPPDAGEAGEPADAARARRLVWWGRVAIGAGRHGLAIQRGYYACLLLGVELR